MVDDRALPEMTPAACMLWMRALYLICLLLPLTFSRTVAQQAMCIQLTTPLGAIVVQLDTVRAPATAANFLRYVDGSHYRGGSFFRTVRADNQESSPVKIAVIQAGIHPWRENDAFDPIPLERTRDSGIRHRDGTISMARAEPHSATWSFFICVGDQPELDFAGARNPDGQGFAAFGSVVEGMDVVRKIHESPAEGQALMPPVPMLNVHRVELPVR